jgi:CheY-like chemotaxis protein
MQAQAVKIERNHDDLTEAVINGMPHLVNAVPANDAHNINILLVDDDDVAVENVMRSMDKLGVRFPVVVAEDGQDALDILREKHPQKKIEAPYLVLLDLKMPRMDGFEFLKAIRKDSQLESTVVYILTTSDSNVDREKAYHENIAGYLLKDTTTMFNWLFSSLPKYTKFKNFLRQSHSIDASSEAH